MTRLPPLYIDRKTGRVCREKVYGKQWLLRLYGSSLLSRLCGRLLAFFITRFGFFSSFYGWLQTLPSSKKKIAPFIEAFSVDASEFEKTSDQFLSFNDFFVRKLKASARPIAEDANTAVIPADGRYLCFPSLCKVQSFFIKGEQFSLETLLRDKQLARQYADGALALGRLAPVDCHRFSFPVDGRPHQTRYINGKLGSVNPFVLWKSIGILQENKRTVCIVETEQFGTIVMLEIGATNVGSIRQTYTAYQSCQRGQEKGFFAFGGSALVLLFKKGAIAFSADLLAHSDLQKETLCCMGEPLGVKP